MGKIPLRVGAEIARDGIEVISIRRDRDNVKWCVAIPRIATSRQIYLSDQRTETPTTPPKEQVTHRPKET